MLENAEEEFGRRAGFGVEEEGGLEGEEEAGVFFGLERGRVVYLAVDCECYTENQEEFAEHALESVQF